MKKFINDVNLVEEQMIQGMVKAFPQYVRKIDGETIVVRANKKEGKALIVAPKSIYNMKTLTKDQNALSLLYQDGNRDARWIGGFIRESTLLQTEMNDDENGYNDGYQQRSNY